MTQAKIHFKLLMYMKKPKPWRTLNDNGENGLNSCEKTRNVNRMCRLLAINRASSILLDSSTPQINKKKCRKRKAEPPFLIRNCISGQENWISYMRNLQNWTPRLSKKRRSSASSSSVTDQSRSSHDNQLGNVPAFPSVSTTSAALLRSFYTLWHIGRISRKSLKTNEEFQTERALQELSVSPIVDKCLRSTPKGGITAEVITDKSQLSKRALQTLSRWARLTEDVVEDGYESGYDEDPVEIWNRAIIFADASYTEGELNNVTKTTAETSFYSTDETTPKRRRSNRVLKPHNLKT